MYNRYNNILKKIKGVELKKASYGRLYSEEECIRDRKNGKKVKWLKDYEVCIDEKDEARFRIKAALYIPDKQTRMLGIKNMKEAIKAMKKRDTPTEEKTPPKNGKPNKKSSSTPFKNKRTLKSSSYKYDLFF